jgi:uncharacterized membrane protein
MYSMSWIFYAIAAIGAGGLADFFRKFGSAVKDPFLDNLIFQAAAFISAIVLYMLFSRKAVPDGNVMTYVIAGGICISIFTTLFFKTLSIGPGVSVVAPIVRAGALILIAILGVVILHEKFTWHLIAGIALTSLGIYMMFLNQ